jgi:hypothetical protein
MVVSRSLLCRSAGQFHALGLARRNDLGNPCKAFRHLNCYLPYSNTVPSYRWSIALPSVRLIFRSPCRTNKNMLSIGLVNISVFPSARASLADAVSITPRRSEFAATLSWSAATPPVPVASAWPRRSSSIPAPW